MSLKMVFEILNNSFVQAIILTGDIGQHNSVLAGDALRALQNYGNVVTARLTKIRRQRDPAFRAAVSLLADKKAYRAFEEFVSGHPLDLFPDIDWAQFCPIADLGNHFGERVKVCGLSFADRIAYQEDGQPMKFISLCDYTGFVETELFAAVYKVFGMDTIKSPLLEIEGIVEPFGNEKGYTLRVLKVNQGKT